MSSTLTPSFIKDPEDVLDYSVDWNADNFLGDDTIDDDVWTVEGGITVDTNSHTDTVATVWLSGGTHGTDYRVECKITTIGGRTAERSILVRVRER